MAVLPRINLLLMAALTVLGSTLGVELLRDPAGVIREGDRVVLTCRVENKSFIDIVRIGKVISSNNNKVALATNNELIPIYAAKSRYSVNYDESGGTATLVLTIDGILPEDAGTYACLKEGNKVSQATEDVNVHVAPASVQFQYSVRGEQQQVMEDNDVIEINSPEETAITCTSHVEGSDVKPHVTLTLGSEDVTNNFVLSHSSNKDQDPNTGFWTSGYTGEWTWSSNNFSPSISGKTLTCTSHMPETDAISTSVSIYINFAPIFDCQTHVNAAMETPDTRLSCRARMNPPPTIVTWTTNNHTISVNNDGTNNTVGPYTAGMQKLDTTEYEFWLSLPAIGEHHYQTYVLTAENNVGDDDIEITLLREGGGKVTDDPSHPGNDLDPEPHTGEGSNNDGVIPPQEQTDKEYKTGNGCDVRHPVYAVMMITVWIYALCVY